MEKRTRILGVSFDNLTCKEACEMIFTACRMKNGLPLSVVTPNPLMVMNARKNGELMASLEYADLSLADGTGVISAAKRLGTPLPERVTGIDTAYSVLERLSQVGGSVYLLGAKPGVAALAAENSCFAWVSIFSLISRILCIEYRNLAITLHLISRQTGSLTAHSL